MLFTSLPFFWLLVGTLVFYYGAARTAAAQIGVLVAASLLFYAWEKPILLILLAFCTGTAAWAGLAVASGGKRRGWIAFVGVGLLLAMLLYFKYAGFLYRTFAGHGVWERFFVGVPLPIGISFYVFHGISLIVDAWRGDWKPPEGEGRRTHFFKTTLYMVFFPQLIAGPITKARDFMPQIGGPKKWADVDGVEVARLLVAGYFFKRVVADNLATETVLMAPGGYGNQPGLQLLFLLLGYSCQIFADFYGYSLIALGLGRLLGYRLPINFDRPYLAASFSEFWRRWHISLSTWLRDYLFIPLGGSRRGLARTAANLAIVMFLGGLWHGAAWGFAIWGLFHGAALVLERPFLRREGEPVGAERLARTALVFAGVTFGWMLFKFPDGREAFAYLGTMAANWPRKVALQQAAPVVCCMVPVLLHHLRPALFPQGFSLAVERWVLAGMLFLIVVNSGVPGAFIYFQF